MISPLKTIVKNPVKNRKYLHFMIVNLHNINHPISKGWNNLVIHCWQNNQSLQIETDEVKRLYKGNFFVDTFNSVWIRADSRSSSNVYE